MKRFDIATRLVLVTALTAGCSNDDSAPESTSAGDITPLLIDNVDATFGMSHECDKDCVMFIGVESSEGHLVANEIAGEPQMVSITLSLAGPIHAGTVASILLAAAPADAPLCQFDSIADSDQSVDLECTFARELVANEAIEFLGRRAGVSSEGGSLPPIEAKAAIRANQPPRIICTQDPLLAGQPVALDTLCMTTDDLPESAGMPVLHVQSVSLSTDPTYPPNATQIAGSALLEGTVVHVKYTATDAWSLSASAETDFAVVPMGAPPKCECKAPAPAYTSVAGWTFACEPESPSCSFVLRSGGDDVSDIHVECGDSIALSEAGYPYFIHAQCDLSKPLLQLDSPTQMACGNFSITPAAGTKSTVFYPVIDPGCPLSADTHDRVQWLAKTPPSTSFVLKAEGPYFVPSDHGVSTNTEIRSTLMRSEVQYASMNSVVLDAAAFVAPPISIVQPDNDDPYVFCCKAALSAGDAVLTSCTLNYGPLGGYPWSQVAKAAAEGDAQVCFDSLASISTAIQAFCDCTYTNNDGQIAGAASKNVASAALIPEVFLQPELADCQHAGCMFEAETTQPPQDACLKWRIKPPAGSWYVVAETSLTSLKPAEASGLTSLALAGGLLEVALWRCQEGPNGVTLVGSNGAVPSAGGDAYAIASRIFTDPPLDVEPDVGSSTNDGGDTWYEATLLVYDPEGNEVPAAGIESWLEFSFDQQTYWVPVGASIAAEEVNCGFLRACTWQSDGVAICSEPISTHAEYALRLGPESALVVQNPPGTHTTSMWVRVSEAGTYSLAYAEGHPGDAAAGSVTVVLESTQLRVLQGQQTLQSKPHGAGPGWAHMQIERGGNYVKANLGSAMVTAAINAPLGAWFYIGGSAIAEDVDAAMGNVGVAVSESMEIDRLRVVTETGIITHAVPIYFASAPLSGGVGLTSLYGVATAVPLGAPPAPGEKSDCSSTPPKRGELKLQNVAGASQDKELTFSYTRGIPTSASAVVVEIHGYAISADSAIITPMLTRQQLAHLGPSVLHEPLSWPKSPALLAKHCLTLEFDFVAIAQLAKSPVGSLESPLDGIPIADNGMTQVLAAQTAVCGDGLPCTWDACSDDAGGCIHGNLASQAPCDDGNPCTTSDVCAGQGCKGIAFEQDAANFIDPCWSPTCDGLQLDFTENYSASCNDSDGCTEADTCVFADGSVKCTGIDVDCGDDNPCTTDSCQQTGGCMHVPAPDDQPVYYEGKLTTCKAGVPLLASP